MQLKDFLESQSLLTAANRFRLPYAFSCWAVPYISLTDMLLLKSVENVGQ